MKLILEIPDKYLDTCKGLMALIDDDDDKDAEDISRCIDEMKGQDIAFSTNMMSVEKGKQLCVGLLMIAIADKLKKEAEEV